MEYASSASSHGGSPEARQRQRRRRIVTLSSSEEHSPAPATPRDASAVVRSDTSATIRQMSGSESESDFQLDRSEPNRRPMARERTTTNSSDEKSMKNSAPADSGWLSRKRPAASLPKPSAKAKRRSDPIDPFEDSDAGTSKKAQRKRTPFDRARPVFDLGLFDSDEETSTAAPLAEGKQNIPAERAESARQARLERARLKQAEFRRRLSEVRVGGQPTSADSGGTTAGGRVAESSFQSRLSAASTATTAADGSRQATANSTSAQVSGRCCRELVWKRSTLRI